jgi:Ca2+-binding EF-hand superfamily protein
MAYSWDNRVNFVIRNMYDIDGNGYLDENDFKCLALRSAIIEAKGEYNVSKVQEKEHIMKSLWEEIAQIADFNKDGQISIEEFKEAVCKCCLGRKYDDFPQAMKMFIDSNFKMMDINDDGVIGVDEFRYNYITKFAVEDIKVVDNAFDKLLNDEDRKRGGLTLSRYQELYAQFLGNREEDNCSVYLFGPLSSS